MDETEAPPPHAGERLTREDVLRLIKEHGGPEGLDLRQADLENADLNQLNLHRVNLERANLRDARLQGANLEGADLQGALLEDANVRGARLRDANLDGAYLEGTDGQQADLLRASLQGARLWRANLRGANLLMANLHGAYLRRANLQRAMLSGANLRDTNLEDADWGDYVLADEVEGDFRYAASTYRALKQRHTELGMFDVAGEFHYREMEARRKLAQEELRVPDLLGLHLFRLLFAYGERPLLVVVWAAVIVFGFALVHWLFGTVSGGFLDALYFSAVSFPALGYGEWSPEPQGWAGRFLGAGESFMGVFMIALFLVTFTRKMTR